MMNDPGQLNSIPISADPLFPGVKINTSHIVGCQVVSPEDVELGKVNEVVMNAFNSRIAFLVVSTGGFFGLGRKQYAVPWKAVKYDNVLHVCIVNLTQDAIAALPKYDKETWPDFGDGRWDRSARSFRALTPLWMP